MKIYTVSALSTNCKSPTTINTPIPCYAMTKVCEPLTSGTHEYRSNLGQVKTMVLAASANAGRTPSTNNLKTKD